MGVKDTYYHFFFISYRENFLIKLSYQRSISHVWVSHVVREVSLWGLWVTLNFLLCVNRTANVNIVIGHASPVWVFRYCVMRRIGGFGLNEFFDMGWVLWGNGFWFDGFYGSILLLVIVNQKISMRQCFLFLCILKIFSFCFRQNCLVNSYWLVF